MPVIPLIEIPQGGPFEKSFTIEFNTPFCVLIGKNSSGKSTILWHIFDNYRKDYQVYIGRTLRGLRDRNIRKNEIEVSLGLEMFLQDTLKEVKERLNQIIRKNETKKNEDLIDFKELLKSLEKAEILNKIKNKKDEDLTDFEKLLQYAPKKVLEEMSKTVSELIGQKVSLERDEQRERKLIIKVNEEKVPIEKLSFGLASILTIEAVLKYPDIKFVRDNRKIIFLIEEIENFLHPNLIRTYISKLKDLAYKNENNVQIIVTSHSNLVVSIAAPHEIIRVDKGNVYYIKEKELSKKFLTKWDYIIDQNKSDFFFSDKVILVEGYTDKLILSPLIEKLNMYRSNISLISIDGVHNKDFMKKLSKNFGIKTLFIRDCDPASGTEPGKANYYEKDNFVEIVLPYIIEFTSSEGLEYKYVEIEDIIPIKDWAYGVSITFPNKTFYFLYKILSFNYIDNSNSKKINRFSEIIKSMKYHLKLYSILYKNRDLDLYKDHPLAILIKIINNFINEERVVIDQPIKVMNHLDILRNNDCLIIDENLLIELTNILTEINFKNEDRILFVYRIEDSSNNVHDEIKNTIQKLCERNINFLFLCSEKHFKKICDIGNELKKTYQSKFEILEKYNFNKNFNELQASNNLLIKLDKSYILKYTKKIEEVNEINSIIINLKNFGEVSQKKVKKYLLKIRNKNF